MRDIGSAQNLAIPKRRVGNGATRHIERMIDCNYRQKELKRLLISLYVKKRKKAIKTKAKGMINFSMVFG